MRRIHKWTVILILAALAVVLCGCLPANYTKDMVKEVKSLHAQETLDWFAQNMPNARVDKTCEPYKSPTNLYAAMTGSYKVNGQRYKYVYDYANHCMYVEDGYQEACSLIKKEMLTGMGMSESNTTDSFHGYEFPLESENDNWQCPVDDDPHSFLEELIPYGITPSEFARQILDNEKEMRIYYSCYLPTDDTYHPEYFERYSNLGGIWYYYPIDVENGYNGVYCAIHTREGVEYQYIHVEKIEEGLYGGYVYTLDEPIEDLLKFRVDGNEITLNIPEKTSPIFFAKKKEKLVSHFVNSTGKEITVIPDEEYRTDCYGNDDYYIFGSGYCVKKNVAAYAYKRDHIVISNGEYYFTRK